MTAILCAAATALAFVVSLGTADVSLLAWVAAVPVLWLAFGREPTRRVAGAAAASYFVGQLGMLWPYQGAMGPVIFAIAIVPALAFMGAVLAARLSAQRLPTWAAALTFPATWTGWEILSATLSPHGTFGAWAYSQLSMPVMVQSASLFGLWIVSFLIALFGSCAALAIRRRTVRPIGWASALVLANAAFGAWTLSRPDAPTIRVAAAARDHDDSSSAASVALAEADEVRRLAKRGAKVVVFDEKAARLAGDQQASVLAPLISAARETRVTVVAGFDQTAPDHRNLALTIAPDGRIRSYTKRHMIPGLEGYYTVGTAAGVLDSRRAVTICKDLDFQGTLRDDALHRARDGGLDLMLAPAWDFGADGWLHARMAILRGVEGGYAIVRAAANGIATVSDAQGRVRARAVSGSGQYASAVGDVPQAARPTLYLRVGDAFGWIAGAAALLLLAASLRSRATIASAPVLPAPARQPS